MVRTPGSTSPTDPAWAALQKLLYRLDKRLTGCPKPAYLPPKKRLQGFAVLEKIQSNIHYHILIDCPDAADQVWTAIQLFEALDTAPVERCDHAWQQETWEALVDRGWIREVGRDRTHSPFLAAIMPRATATVQLVKSDDDREKTCRYITKELGAGTLELANASDHWAAKSDLQIRALKEWHAPIQPNRYARNYSVDPDTGTLILNLDKPTWKVAGKTLC